MELKSYVFSIIIASVIAGILLTLIKSNSTYGVFLKLLSGLFVALTVISPWKDFHLSDVSYYFNDWKAGADSSVALGVSTYNEALRASIIESTQAYILEKASSMGAQLSATVTVSDDQPPVPVAVEISGAISPYNKAKMQQMIADNLGIPEEAQSWR